MKKQLIDIINGHDIISFDIFDTLLFRNVYRPIDIFKIIEKKLNISDFTNIRIECERKARTTDVSGEIDIDEIYKQIADRLQISIKESNIIKNMELNTELEFIEANKFMQEIFNYCVSQRKKIYLISDMYLKEDFIKKLLKHCGYNKYNGLYVSYKYKSNKGTGQLYEIVKNTNNLDYGKWLHIGDNIVSDFKVPKKLGISAYYYKNINSYDNYLCDSIFESIMLAIRNNYIYSGYEENYWKKFGVANIAPIYLGFTNFVYQMTYDADNLFFIARDGYIVQKIYDMFPKSNDKYINYIYCSRKSVQIPALILGSQDYMMNYLISGIDDECTLEELFRKCQLQPKKEYMRFIKVYGFTSYNDRVTKEKKYSAQKCISILLEEIRNNLKGQLSLAHDYLVQEKLGEFDITNIVDIGWGGSIQESIEKILNKKVKGFYFGTLDLGKKDYCTNSFGFAFDQGNDSKTKNNIYSQVMMYEMIFSAPHGSTIEYKKVNNEIIPVLGPTDDYSDIVNIFQKASLDVIQKALNYFDYYDCLSSEFCIQFYNKFLSEYKYDDLVHFSKYSNDYVLGSNKKYPYVQIFSKQYVHNNFIEFEKKITKSLWNGAYLIEGFADKNSQDKYIRYVQKKYGRKTKTAEKKESLLRTAFRRYVPLKIRKYLKRHLSVSKNKHHLV